MARKQAAALLLCAAILLSMACTISYEGVSFGSDPEIEHIEDITATAEHALPAIPDQPQTQSTPAPTQPPAAPQDPPAETNTTGPSEYSVTATNNDCICQVNGNVTVEFNFKGDQLEVKNTGGAVDVYDKIAENTYKRSWMGYYILTSGEGENKTETKVDEERSAVIIFNDSGYIMQHYQGASSSPCCVHTFTKNK